MLIDVVGIIARRVLGPLAEVRVHVIVIIRVVMVVSAAVRRPQQDVVFEIEKVVWR